MKNVREIEPTVDRYLTQIAIELGMDLVNVRYRLVLDPSGEQKNRLVITGAYAPIECTGRCQS
jgi:hypothetical protein